MRSRRGRFLILLLAAGLCGDDRLRGRGETGWRDALRALESLGRKSPPRGEDAGGAAAVDFAPRRRETQESGRAVGRTPRLLPGGGAWDLFRSDAFFPLGAAPAAARKNHDSGSEPRSQPGPRTAPGGRRSRDGAAPHLVVRSSPGPSGLPPMTSRPRSPERASPPWTSGLRDPDWDGIRITRRGPAGATPSRWSFGRTRRTSLSSSPAQTKARKGRRDPEGEGGRRFKPPSLRDALGPRPLRPPKSHPPPPDFAALKDRVPARLPDGSVIRPQAPVPASVEALRPPDSEESYKAWKEEDARRRDAHWHDGAGRSWRHEGSVWGRAAGEDWAWLVLKDRRWWTSAAQKPQEQPLLDHLGRWWWDVEGVWFLLHQGEPWAYRRLHEWGLDALVHPGTGTRMVYSADGRRAAVLTPGEETILYDVESGEELGRWPPED